MPQCPNRRSVLKYRLALGQKSRRLHSTSLFVLAEVRAVRARPMVFRTLLARTVVAPPYPILTTRPALVPVDAAAV